MMQARRSKKRDQCEVQGSLTKRLHYNKYEVQGSRQ